MASIASTTLTACALGERPSFEDSPTVEGTTTGDPAIDAVLAQLDGVDSALFTASYDATQLFGGTQSSVTVTQTGVARRSVTIGQVRYITDGGSNRTCFLDAQTCDDGIQAAAVSNTGVTPDVAFGDMAKRLRRDAVARVAPSTATTLQIAGNSATCVDVAVSGGTKQYCVLPDGVIARFRGADLTLELTGYRPAPDETLFRP
ncbi:MAG: hypothetical protein KDB40_15120 [Acidimicrobiales bacterium]|nr:hypothetical protein [Acidimicrobiales bacterium]MCB9394732.1 hypothetical protein [Acidimicrobiaceae bacterium]